MRRNSSCSTRATGGGLIQYGASFFLLEKMGAVVGVSNLHIYAAMRGQTLEAFQQTRNQQVTYSVAGKR
ncbi:protocatechuate 4,5-dioxygenase [Klebsiella pneumoniae]|nr:protocatechuate 4,5-dioxygenase [Klebsiella pneumoniae]